MLLGAWWPSPVIVIAEGPFEALEDTAGPSTRSAHRVIAHHRLLPSDLMRPQY